MNSAYHEFAGLWKDLMRTGLAEDGWQWDWTSLGSVKGSEKVEAQIVAKSEGIWAGESLLAILPGLAADHGGKLQTTSVLKDGTRQKPGMIVAKISGPARLVLAYERPCLNLASYAGGIATQTRKLVDQVEQAWKKLPAEQKRTHETPRVTSTRKILPHYRDLAIYGVRAGGGWSHRLNLSGGVLIKENHIASAGGIKAAVEGVKKVAPHGLKIEIEVTSLKELDQAVAAKVDGVLLDNFSLSLVSDALKKLNALTIRPFVEVSGGLNGKNIGSYVFGGVNVLSVGSLTHSVQATDLSLLIK